jgi:hypothetical protein
MPPLSDDDLDRVISEGSTLVAQRALFSRVLGAVELAQALASHEIREAHDSDADDLPESSSSDSSEPSASSLPVDATDAEDFIAQLAAEQSD